jgi:hypothetical protein
MNKRCNADSRSTLQGREYSILATYVKSIENPRLILPCLVGGAGEPKSALVFVPNILLLLLPKVLIYMFIPPFDREA